jgi:Na+/pantothenate symporter
LKGNKTAINRKQVLNRKNLTNQGKHNKQVLKTTTMLISVIVSFVVMATPLGVFHVISFFKSKAIHEEYTTLYQSGRYGVWFSSSFSDVFAVV